MLTYELQCNSGSADSIVGGSVMVYDAKETPTDFLASDVNWAIINISCEVVAHQYRSLKKYSTSSDSTWECRVAAFFEENRVGGSPRRKHVTT
jgi:hypothetical protein